MAVERAELLIKDTATAVMSQRAHTRGRRPQLQCIRRAFRFPLIGLLLVVAVGCSSNKTQTISESYVQSVVNLNNGAFELAVLPKDISVTIFVAILVFVSTLL